MTDRRQRLALMLPTLGGGGAERVALSLCRHWIEAGHEVHLLLGRAEGRLLGDVPDAAIVHDLRAPRMALIGRPLRASLASIDADAMMALMAPLTIHAVRAHRRARLRGRLLLSDHTLISREYAHWPWWRRSWLRRAVAAHYPRASARIAVAAAVADDLAAFGGIDRATVTVIPNPHQPPPSPPPDPVRAMRRWGGEGLRLLSIGRLDPVKNHALAIRALAHLPDARLTILGEGGQRRPLEQLAHRLKVADRLVMPGFVADPSSWLADAQMFLLTSTMEAYGLVLVEAMAAGLPIVTTAQTGGAWDVVGGGRFATLVEETTPDRLAAAIAAQRDVPHNAAAARRQVESLNRQALAGYDRLMLRPSL